ncbi:MAG TPA: sigma-70 family RNA polymerase sigma factor [Burkholderiales bacterium]|nr:sigma-70 family RNA polymerase sigma factor [Burkholderiales bacterium]
MEYDDREAIRRAQDGDHAAYGALVRRHQDRVYRYLLRLTGSHDEALELTQEAFIKAWEALPAWRPEAQFHTWLFRIASNAAMDVLRRRKVVDFVALEEDYDAPAEAPGPEAQLDTKQRLHALDAALARLTVEQREMILLREVEGLSYEEISAALGIHEGTVKSRLARARVALAAAYEGKHP